MSGKDAQVAAVVRVVRHVNPDVLVLADIDYDHNSAALSALADGIGGYQYRFARLPNRGQQSGYDLDGDARKGRADDAWGYGEYTGQGGLAVLSKFPLGHVVNFSNVRWSAQPNSLALPDTHPEQPLSTTAHWEVPVMLSDGQRLTLLTWHATAPVFDGPEDRNGRRNHDEAAFWLDRLRDEPPDNVVIAGFANMDVFDSEGLPDALEALLVHPLVRDVRPESDGARVAGQSNKTHRGPPELDTVDWPEDGPGNLRVDYILPSREFTILDAGVFWPAPDQPLARDAELASRHRIVWVDVRLPQR